MQTLSLPLRAFLLKTGGRVRLGKSVGLSRVLSLRSKSSSSSPTPSKEHWDKFSSTYEEELSGSAAQLFGTLLYALNVTPGQSVLEIGCGPGKHFKLLEAALPADITYVATDFSSAMVKRAEAEREAAERARHGGARLEAESSSMKVKVQPADAQSLSFSTSSIDRYISNLCFNFLPAPQEAMTEAFRVLKPGGVAGISVWGQASKSSFFTISSKAVEALGLPKLGHRVEGPSPFLLGSKPQRLVQSFQDCGFAPVVHWNTFLPLPLLDGEAYARHRLSVLQGTDRQYLEALSDASRAQLVKCLASEAATELAAGRPIGIDILCVMARKPVKGE